MSEAAGKWDIDRFVVSLARPVVHGWITPEVAEIMIANAVSQLFREGRQESRFTWEAYVESCRMLLDITVQHEARRWEGAASRIGLVVSDLIRRRVPSNRLLAEAHNVNGERSFPLTEPEVMAVVREEVAGRWRPSAQSKGRRLRGG